MRVDAARVIREGRALMRIASPHVIRIFDVAELPHWGPYLVLERLHGSNLAVRAPLGQPWPFPSVMHLGLQVCDGLAHAHAVGIIHRDIKLSNLFVARQGPQDIIKVLDFGIAKVTGTPGAAATASTLTKGALGSPQFMSPEQVATPRLVDARTDLWSLGVVMFRLATGRFPFDGSSLGELSAAVLKARVPTLQESGIHAPVALQAILDRCLARKLDERWPSAVDLGTSLRALGG
jgi:serine/threonine-protein kinase